MTKRKANPAKRGRKSKFRPEFVQRASDMALVGATDAEIAKVLRVSLATFKAFKEKHPEFLAALKGSKEAADANVERALYRRAIGYSHPDTHISNFQGDITITPITKHYAPDATSCIFWLKNRKPAEWRDRLEHTGKDGAPLNPEPPNAAEVARRVAFLLAAGIAKQDTTA
jgi:hypothetical protein